MKAKSFVSGQQTFTVKVKCEKKPKLESQLISHLEAVIIMGQIYTIDGSSVSSIYTWQIICLDGWSDFTIHFTHRSLLNSTRCAEGMHRFSEFVTLELLQRNDSWKDPANSRILGIKFVRNTTLARQKLTNTNTLTDKQTKDTSAKRKQTRSCNKLKWARFPHKPILGLVT